MSADHAEIVHLRANGVSLVVVTSPVELPRVLHWGADLGDIDDTVLRGLVLADIPQRVSGVPDERVSVSLLPEQSRAWLGTPGIEGNRDGADFSVRFDTVRHRVLPGVDEGGTLVVDAIDTDARLGLELECELTPQGLVRLRAGLTNTGDDDYRLDGLRLALPVPLEADELLDFTGRHLRERSPQRSPFTLGTHLREGRRGRTGADATLLMIAGRAGFGFRSGQVWGLHTAWSGNHVTYAERNNDGVSVLGGGELLLSGELTLAPGERYVGPWVLGSFGDGLDAMSARFHDFLRARPQHPRTPRPVTVNVWEAVYFDHEIGRLTALADAAAEVGAERFVLDDGWFRHRRDDGAGLGDWFVDPDVWPGGLSPLVDHVTGLGMQFGLWFEPEMINPDSDLARSHPEWIMATGNRTPPLSRRQQVLDLGHPEAYAYVLDRVDALVTEYAIPYLKWDHNRDLIEAGHSPHGRAGVHVQTLAVYRLIDELKSRHPGLEIESCSSGGSRIDLGILDRTDRVWASDCIDAHERHLIQRGTEMLLPPELIGEHIGSPTNHSTGRTLHLDFRAGTAFFGHFGIEWDLTTADDAARARVAQWIEVHKRHRELLHTGVVVHGDHPDPAVLLRGVVARDGAEALFSIAVLDTSVWAPQGRIRVPGLDPDRSYRVALLPPGDETAKGNEVGAVAWGAGGVVLTGRALAEVGVQVPALFPDRMVLLHVQA